MMSIDHRIRRQETGTEAEHRPATRLAFPTKRWRRTTQQLLRLEGRVIHQLSL
jgi:hypothetical protein